MLGRADTRVCPYDTGNNQVGHTIRRTWGLSLLFRPEPKETEGLSPCAPGINHKNAQENRPLVRKILFSYLIHYDAD